MDASAVLALLNSANSLVGSLATLVPEIEANYEQAKAALSETDNAKLQAQITQLHADTQSLTARLDALKDN
jgi:hypothetical protein